MGECQSQKHIKHALSLKMEFGYLHGLYGHKGINFTNKVTPRVLAGKWRTGKMQSFHFLCVELDSDTSHGEELVSYDFALFNIHFRKNTFVYVIANGVSQTYFYCMHLEKESKKKKKDVKKRKYQN